nr:C39 family peptidase [Pyrinomonadaceae bacterium]
MFIPENELQQITELHEKSLHSQAYKLAQTIAPLAEWEGTEAIMMASHLAYNLGAIEMSRKWTAKAWRNDKKHPRALFYYASDILHRKGALPALIFVRKHNGEFRGDERLKAWWTCLRAEIFVQLRDFPAADIWHQKALEIAPQESWVWVSMAHNLEFQDRYEESLEMSRKALEIDGGGRSSVYQTAHILTLLERYDEALEILTEASPRLENIWIVRQLADLQTELGMHKEAFASLERIIELTPLREEKFSEWLYGSLSDSAYLNGDIPKAIEFAGVSSSPFHLKIKENLENSDETKKRVRLKLGFLRQHHLTCAPATLSNISRFWEKKNEHLELADEMCYDGTPAYKERLWANQNGWETREFTINWKNTTELINRGVPFTLATIQPGNGHLQAVVGYDEKRRTFLVRDPFYQRFDEYLAEELLENQKSNGPRGLALTPKEKAELLSDLEFAESRQYDFQFAVETALENHDREAAAKAFSAMEKEFPAHRLTWSARWTLARYDANNLKLLEAAEKLLEQF